MEKGSLVKKRSGEEIWGEKVTVTFVGGVVDEY